MLCPKCGCSACMYGQKRKDFHKTKELKFKRTDFSAICPKCGWEGEIR